MADLRAVLRLVPLSQRQAAVFIREHHRHSNPDRGDIFRVGLEADGELVAVATAGRPKAAGLQDGRTIEITRVCSLGAENACSMLYGALCRAAKALGYERAYTYTLASEPGSSPRAAGFHFDAVVGERNWAEESGYARYSENLLGETMTPSGPKKRWRRDL
jgi:hypothetical protein